MTKISIIVPIYNSEQFIERCIISVLEQSFQDWELLLVDDGSMDSSLNICKQYAKKDARIKSFHQENSGVSTARLKGLSESAGEYISFLDSDDALPSNALEILYDNVIENYDIVIGTLSNVVLSGEIIEKEHYDWTGGEISTSEQYALGLLKGNINPYLCGALYKKSTFDTSAFRAIIKAKLFIGEDWCLKLLCSNRVTKVKNIKDVVYYYYENQCGTMNTSVMSCKYIDRVEKVLESFKLNFSKGIAKELECHFMADRIRCFFQPELPFSLSEYRKIVAYLSNVEVATMVGKMTLSKYLLFIHCLPAYFIYTRLFCLLYKYKKLKGKNRRIID